MRSTKMAKTAQASCLNVRRIFDRSPHQEPSSWRGRGRRISMTLTLTCVEIDRWWAPGPCMEEVRQIAKSFGRLSTTVSLPDPQMSRNRSAVIPLTRKAWLFAYSTLKILLLTYLLTCSVDGRSNVQSATVSTQGAPKSNRRNISKSICDRERRWYVHIYRKSNISLNYLSVLLLILNILLRAQSWYVSIVYYRCRWRSRQKFHCSVYNKFIIYNFNQSIEQYLFIILNP